MASAIGPCGARATPRPSSASIARSIGPSGAAGAIATPAARASASARAASGGSRAGSPCRLTHTSRPMRCRWMAATSPSPPLLPGPAAIQIRPACGARARARRATPRPARCINACGGRPASASASIARDAAASCTGQRAAPGTTRCGRSVAVGIAGPGGSAPIVRQRRAGQPAGGA
jgi:hypothetical protein